MNIFVAKLNYQTDEEQLRSLFETYGEVSSVKIVFDREQGRSKGFGFVEMPDSDSATNAINELNDSEFDGRNIVVKKANPKPENGGGFSKRRY
jgi:RNA recognition motif-containing protein